MRVIAVVRVSVKRVVGPVLTVLLASDHVRRYLLIGLGTPQHLLLLAGGLVLTELARTEALAALRIFFWLVKVIVDLLLSVTLRCVRLRAFLLASLRVTFIPIIFLRLGVICNLRSDQLRQLLRGQVFVVLGDTAGEFLAVLPNVLYDLLALLKLLLQLLVFFADVF